MSHPVVYTDLHSLPREEGRFALSFLRVARTHVYPYVVSSRLQHDRPEGEACCWSTAQLAQVQDHHVVPSCYTAAAVCFLLAYPSGQTAHDAPRASGKLPPAPSVNCPCVPLRASVATDFTCHLRRRLRCSFLSYLCFRPGRVIRGRGGGQNSPCVVRVFSWERSGSCAWYGRSAHRDDLLTGCCPTARAVWDIGLFRAIVTTGLRSRRSRRRSRVGQALLWALFARCRLVLVSLLSNRIARMFG